MATPGNERYIRSLLILVEGGMFITKYVITKKLAESGDVIDTVIKPFERKLKHVFPEKQFDKLFPQCGDTDIMKWDLQLLTGVLDCVFSKTLDKIQGKAVRQLKYLRNAVQAHSITASYDDAQYQGILDDITEALETLSSCYGDDVQKKCKDLIARYSQGPLDWKSAKDLMIKLQEVDDMLTTVLEAIESTNKCVEEIGKSIKDDISGATESTKKCVKETGKSIEDKVSEATESVNKCVEEVGNSIKDEVSALERRVMEKLEEVQDGIVKKTIQIGCHTQINIGGPSEEWIQLIETTLNFLFNKADEETQGSGDFVELKKRVNELLEPIRNSKDVRFKVSKQKCIMLYLEITSYDGLMELLTILGNDTYQSHLINLVQALKEYFQLSDPIYISSQIPHVTLMQIASELGLDINLKISSETSSLDLDVPASQTEANVVSEDVNGDEIVPLSGKQNDTVRGIQLEMECCSLDGFENVLQLFKSCELSQKIQGLQEELMRHYGEKIEMKASLVTRDLVAADLNEVQSKVEAKHASTTENTEMSLIDVAKVDEGTITSVSKERSVKSPKGVAESEEAAKYTSTTKNVEIPETDSVRIIKPVNQERTVNSQTVPAANMFLYTPRYKWRIGGAGTMVHIFYKTYNLLEGNEHTPEKRRTKLDHLGKSMDIDANYLKDFFEKKNDQGQNTYFPAGTKVVCQELGTFDKMLNILIEMDKDSFIKYDRFDCFFFIFLTFSDTKGRLHFGGRTLAEKLVPIETILDVVSCLKVARGKPKIFLIQSDDLSLTEKVRFVRSEKLEMNELNIASYADCVIVQSTIPQRLVTGERKESLLVQAFVETIKENQRAFKEKEDFLSMTITLSHKVRDMIKRIPDHDKLKELPAPLVMSTLTKCVNFHEEGTF